MNIQAQLPKTAFEAALIDGFAERLSGLAGSDAVAANRLAAIEALKVSGLPTRRMEAWHYTDLRQLLRDVPARSADIAIAELEPLLDGGIVLRIDNGQVSSGGTLIDGVSLFPVSDLMSRGALDGAFQPRGSDDAIGQLNTAFVSDGFSLEFAANRTFEVPVELQNLHSGGEVHVRFPVRVGAGSKATIVERQSGDGRAFVSSVSDIDVGAGADIVWLIVQEQHSETDHLGQINVKLAKDAKLTLFVMNAGGKLVRQEINVDVAGEGADFTLRTVNLLAGDSHTDVTMVLDHREPETTSSQIVRNVVIDRARGVFQGQIRVAPIAQKTDAQMACNTLLLSDDAEFSTKPELEIFADDVQCGHGATVAEIGKDQLFYLMSRGISEKAARGLLVKAFLAEIVEELDDEPTIAALELKLDRWFEQNG